MTAEQENLKKLLEIYRDKLRILKEFRALSFKIKEELAEKGEEAAESVEILTEDREKLLEKIKEADMSARYCESRTGEKYNKIIKEIKSVVKNNAQPAFEREWE